MKACSKIPQIVSNFTPMIKTQFFSTIKILGMDNAMEYKETYLIYSFSLQGIVTQWSCPRTPNQNGRAESNHKYLLDTVNDLLISSKCSEYF